MVFVLTPERDGVAPPEAQLSEASPLLPRQPESSLPDDRKVTHPRAFFAFIFALLFTTGFAIVSVPSIAIYRHIVCRTDYTNLGAYIRHGLSDERCLTDAISSKVSELIGLDGLITFSTALCTVLGYGRMADTYGGKPPLYIATSCSILALLWTVLVVSKASVWNYKFVLVGSVIAGLGGFAPSLRMSVNSIVCDCYHGESRLIAMSYMIAANLVAAIWAPAIGGWLLQIGLLWPLWGGICLLLCYLVALSFLPETHPRLQFERSEILRGGETTTLTNDESMYDSLDKPSASTVVLVFQTCWETISVMTIFLRGRNFALLGLIAFITKFDTQILIVVMQFLTKQLKWSVTVVGYYYASLHAGQLIVLLVILPLFTRFMRARVPRHLLDIWMVKSGLLFNTLAFLGCKTHLMLRVKIADMHRWSHV